MSNEIVKYEKQNNIQTMPRGKELSELLELSKTLATCPFYAKMGSGGVLAICLFARELNLPIMTCLNGGLYTFDGKVTLSAQLMNMMIVNAGHRADVFKLDENGCKIRFWRKDRRPGQGDTFEYEFTIEDARKAGYLTKTNWKNHLRDMLYSRCLSGGARKFMPDTLMNVYVRGEIIDDSFNDDHLENVMPEIEFPENQIEFQIQPDSSLILLEEIISKEEDPVATKQMILDFYAVQSLDQVPKEAVDKMIKKLTTKQTEKIVVNPEENLIEKVS